MKRADRRAWVTHPISNESGSEVRYRRGCTPQIRKNLNKKRFCYKVEGPATNYKRKGRVHPADKYTIEYFREVADRIFNAMKMVAPAAEERARPHALAAAFEVVATEMEAEWKKVPTYSEEKASHDGEWTPQDHFNTYWRPWSDAGLLFQDQLRELDLGFINAARGWCRRHNVDHTLTLPPTKSKRIDWMIDHEDLLPDNVRRNLRQAQRYRDRGRSPS